eukprot:g19238.t1
MTESPVNNSAGESLAEEEGGHFEDPLIEVDIIGTIEQEKDMEDSEICVEHANILGHFEIKKEVVLSLLKSVKMDKSSEPNGIHPRLLREARKEIVGALTKIFVPSLATGEVLEDCQVANFVPLFKKGNRDNPGNYRP